MPFALTLDRIRNIGYYAIYGLLLALSLATVAGYLYQPQWMYHNPSVESSNNVITEGLPMLLRWLPRDMQSIIDPTALNASLPTFVLPYFYYLQDSAAGDVASAKAWAKSVVPGMVILDIVAISLLLAWLSHRKRRTARRDVQQVAPMPGSPDALAESAPLLSEGPVVPVSSERRDEAQPSY
jgi:hypothetical protein